MNILCGVGDMKIIQAIKDFFNPPVKPYIRGEYKLTEQSADVIHDWLKANLELDTETSIASTRVTLKIRGEEISAVTILNG